MNTYHWAFFIICWLFIVTLHLCKNYDISNNVKIIKNNNKKSHPTKINSKTFCLLSTYCVLGILSIKFCTFSDFLELCILIFLNVYMLWAMFQTKYKEKLLLEDSEEIIFAYHTESSGIYKWSFPTLIVMRMFML